MCVKLSDCRAELGRRSVCVQVLQHEEVGEDGVMRASSVWGCNRLT